MKTLDYITITRYELNRECGTRNIYDDYTGFTIKNIVGNGW